MAIAAGGSDIEPRRDVPAEAAVELVVVGGFGEHERSSFFTSPRIAGRGRILSVARIRGEGQGTTPAEAQCLTDITGCEIGAAGESSYLSGRLPGPRPRGIPVRLPPR